MYVNGLIWAKAKSALTGTETGTDEDGNPVSAEPAVWNAPLQACVQQISENLRARYEDGRYHAATYRINIEIPPFLFQPEVIKLAQYGQMLGEFPVISCKLLPTVGRIEIFV